MKNRKKPMAVAYYIRVGSPDQLSDRPMRSEAAHTKQSKKKKQAAKS